MAVRFVGRAPELRALEGFLTKPAPAVGVIYGRRRIGKSLLIQQALAGRPALTFEGLENRPKKDQIAAFLFQLAHQTPPADAGNDLRSWREALVRLIPVLEQRPACIVLDEFQWLANYRREMVSDLKLVWEQYLSKVSGVKLILCGSIASFMTTKVVRSSALYGRTDLEIHLKEFQLDETQQMLSDKGLDEVIEASLYFGGVPKYLELVLGYPSVRAAVEELAFRENGYFLEEYDRIFTSHFGRNPDFRKIVAALAACPQGLLRQELVRQAGITAGGLLSEHLADLEAAGFVSSVVPFDKGEQSRLIKYYRVLRYRFHVRPVLSCSVEGCQRPPNRSAVPAGGQRADAVRDEVLRSSHRRGSCERRGEEGGVPATVLPVKDDPARPGGPRRTFP